MMQKAITANCLTGSQPLNSGLLGNSPHQDFIAELDVTRYGISPWSAGSSCVCPAPCAPQAPGCGGRVGNREGLEAGKHRSATAEARVLISTVLVTDPKHNIL